MEIKSKTPLHWRTLEFHICEILRAEGFELDQTSDTGDKTALPTTHGPLNLTLFAQALAERLES